MVLLLTCVSVWKKGVFVEACFDLASRNEKFARHSNFTCNSCNRCFLLSCVFLVGFIFNLNCVPTCMRSTARCSKERWKQNACVSVLRVCV